MIKRVLQAAFDVINAAPLAGRERGNKRFGFFRRLLAIKIRQPAHGVSVATVHTQRLLVIAFSGGVIFARHRHIAQPQHRIAVGVIDIARLLEQAFCPVGIIGFQRSIALLDRQPVAIHLQQTVPFVVVAAVRIQREGFFQIRHRISTIAILRIRLPQRPRNAAKTSETNAGNSAKAAASSKTAAQNAATAAEHSETNARASEEASADSEEASRRNAESAAENAGIATTKAREAAADATKAGQKKDEALSAATRAEKAADRAEAAAEVTAEPYANIVPPLPDVWIPFNDTLDMITGFSPSYKKIVIGDDEITMPGDKIVKFKRASTATYINKSGQLKLAEVDEPRFERDGLLIEGQRTNYLRNSNKPDSWTVHSALNKTFGTDKQGFNYATVTPTESIVGTTGGYTVHGVVAADRFPLASGECFTFSCRVKGAKARCRLRVSVIIGGTDTFSADSYLDLDTRIATVSGNTSLITAKAEQQGEWTYYEATYTANTDIDTVNCAFYMTNKISNEPFYDDSTLTMTTPQIELGNTASSFIVTTMPTTRASDVVTIPSQNNLSTRPFTVLCEVSRNWSTPPNVAPRIFDVGGHSIDDNYLSLGFVSTGKISANVGMVQPQISSDGERFIVGVRAKSDLSVNAICSGNYTTNLNGKIFGVTATSYRFGGQTAAGTRHLFGHIRNFRVWFKELNDRQIKEAV